MKLKQILKALVAAGVAGNLLLPVCCSAEPPALLAQLKNHKVSVAVYPQGDGVRASEKTAQARLETILLDNGITTLDQAKADELKRNWKNAGDSDYKASAEDVENYLKKYEIKAFLRVYLSADVAAGLADYFSGTAKADVRVVFDDARVQSATSAPMGTRGNPPCDAITRDSALKNALEVALDDACGKLGCQIADPAKPRSVSLILTGPVPPPSGDELHGVADSSAPGLLKKQDQTWAKEKVDCTAKSPDGGLAVVGAHVDDIDFHRRPPMIRGAKLHLVDLNTQAELQPLLCYAVEKKEMSEKGERLLSDCLFLGSWRFAATVSGSDLFLWDTETGRSDRQRFDSEMKQAKLGYVRTAEGAYLVVRSGSKVLGYKLERKS